MKTSLRRENLEYLRDESGARILKWFPPSPEEPAEQGYDLAYWIQGDGSKEYRLVYIGTRPLRLNDSEQVLFHSLVEFGYADLEDR